MKTLRLVMDREAWRAAIHGRKELDTTEQLNGTELKVDINVFNCVLSLFILVYIYLSCCGMIKNSL